MAGVAIRKAEDADLDGLSGLEARTFVSDRMAPRSFRRLLGRPSAALRVAASKDGRLHGYHLVLFRKGSPVARLYSIAVDRADRGSGIGTRLLADAERVASRHGKTALRLEVRADNRPAIRLYERRGYRRIGRYLAYYADAMDALRYEKTLSGNAGDRWRRRASAPTRRA